jgi:hypothetical protein
MEKPGLNPLFGGRASLDAALLEAYRRHGYRMAEIAEYLDVHYATVSQRLRWAEESAIARPDPFCAIDTPFVFLLESPYSSVG